MHTQQGSVAGLLLAAGAGRRMGGPKALLPFEGRLLVERGIELLTASECSPVHVVLGAAADEIRAHVGSATVVRNDDWPSGLASSLRAGLLSMPAEADAVVIALVDQPRITPEAVRRLLAAYRRGGRLVVASYDGKPRNPTLIGHEHWPGVLDTIHGDEGARGYLRAHRSEVTAVPCEDVADPADLDTVDDVGRLERTVSDKPAPRDRRRQPGSDRDY